MPSAPVPSSRGLRASLRNVEAFKANPLTFYRRLTWGDDGAYRERVPFDMFGANVLVNDPEAVGRILTSALDDGRYTKDGLRFFAILGRVLGNGLFTSEGHHHLAQRRKLQPAFQPRAIEPMIAGMRAAADEAARRWATRVGEVLDVQAEMRWLALDVLAHTLVGADLREHVHAFGAANAIMEDRLIASMGAPFLLPRWIPSPGNRRFARAATDVHRVVLRILEGHRARPPGAPEAALLLGRLMDGMGTPDGMTLAQVFVEVMTLLVGGYQSTAVALTWTWYLLAQHPAAMRRIVAEVRALPGGAVTSHADLQALPYTRMVVLEALRLYPPVWVLHRAARARDHVAGAPIARGTIVAICPYTLHRHPAHWSHPETFHPEHFAAEHVRPGAAYLPFGAGRHKCIGQHHAVAAVLVALASLVPRFAFDPPAEPIVANTRAFTTPEPTLRMRLRSPEAESHPA